MNINIIEKQFNSNYICHEIVSNCNVSDLEIDTPLMILKTGEHYDALVISGNDDYILTGNIPELDPYRPRTSNQHTNVTRNEV